LADPFAFRGYIAEEIEVLGPEQRTEVMKENQVIPDHPSGRCALGRNRPQFIRDRRVVFV
jgi:hypothetical protein